MHGGLRYRKDYGMAISNPPTIDVFNYTGSKFVHMLITTIQNLRKFHFIFQSLRSGTCPWMHQLLEKAYVQGE